MPRATRSDILARFHAMAARGEPIIGAGAGTGISAKSEASSIEVEVCASTASSLSSFTRGVSLCVSPAARSIWPIIG